MSERQIVENLQARIKLCRETRTILQRIKSTPIQDVHVQVDAAQKNLDQIGWALQAELELHSAEGQLVAEMVKLGYDAGLWQLGGGILACGINLAPDVTDEGFMCYLMADHCINGYWQVGFYRAEGDESEPTWQLSGPGEGDDEPITKSVAASIDHLLRTFGRMPDSFDAQPTTTQEEQS